jgi:hypothetical protein
MMYPLADVDPELWIKWRLACMHAVRVGDPQPPMPTRAGAASSLYEGQPPSEAALLIERRIRALLTRCDYSAHLRMMDDDGTPQT